MLNKDLMAASSKPLVLSILQEGESYGYAIIQRVREISSERIEWTDGMLYPVLHRLEREKLISSDWRKSESGRERKYYRITALGREALKAEREQWDAVNATFRSLGWPAENAVPKALAL